MNIPVMNVRRFFLFFSGRAVELRIPYVRDAGQRMLRKSSHHSAVPCLLIREFLQEDIQDSAEAAEGLHSAKRYV
jgi:hypothetical protein